MSIIVPIYNCAQYIKDCLDSVVLQNKISLEVICIDDGSTDSSLEIVKEYQKAQDCISIISKPNEGLSIARNIGLKYARGAYVQFLDSDDMLAPGALDCLYQVSKEKNLDVLFFNAKTIYDDESLRQTFPQYENYYVAKTDLSQPRRGLDLLVCLQKFNEYRTPVWRQFFKRSFLIENSLTFEDHIVHEDNLFTFQALCKASLAARINESLYCRRIRLNSIMTTPTKFENVYGYLRCYLGMVAQFLSLNTLTEEKESCVKQITDSIAKAVTSNYMKLDIYEQKRVSSLTPMEEHFFTLLSSRSRNAVIKKVKIQAKQEQIKIEECSEKCSSKSKNSLKITNEYVTKNSFISTVYKIITYLKRISH